MKHKLIFGLASITLSGAAYWLGKKWTEFQFAEANEHILSVLQLQNEWMEWFTTAMNDPEADPDAVMELAIEKLTYLQIVRNEVVQILSE